MFGRIQCAGRPAAPTTPRPAADPESSRKQAPAQAALQGRIGTTVTRKRCPHASCCSGSGHRNRHAPCRRSTQQPKPPQRPIASQSASVPNTHQSAHGTAPCRARDHHLDILDRELHDRPPLAAPRRVGAVVELPQRRQRVLVRLKLDKAQALLCSGGWGLGVWGWGQGPRDGWSRRARAPQQLGKSPGPGVCQDRSDPEADSEVGAVKARGRGHVQGAGRLSQVVDGSGRSLSALHCQSACITNAAGGCSPSSNATHSRADG